MTMLRAFSFGGGQQSVAALVLAAEKKIDFPLFIFANVGDDSENPETLHHVENYAKPYAAKHGIELVEVRRIMKRTGRERTLLEHLEMPASRSIDIPVKMANGAPGHRKCTDVYKIQLIAEETARRGATEENPAIIGIGISQDEIGRATNHNSIPHQRKTYPLIGTPAEHDTGLRLTRLDCQRIIKSAGLPVPPKSACWFCPMQRPEGWHDRRRTQPELFEKACGLEDMLNKRRGRIGRPDPAYFTRFGKPLRQAIPDGIDLLPMADEDEGCDSGWCGT
jgi:hypothetical protein